MPGIGRPKSLQPLREGERSLHVAGDVLVVFGEAFQSFWVILLGDLMPEPGSLLPLPFTPVCAGQLQQDPLLFVAQASFS